MPKVDGAVMTFAKPSWTPFHEDYVKTMADLGKAVQGLGEDEWCILMFDELNRAPRDSQQAVFQMIYDRTNDDVPLSDRCIIMSAINDNSDVYQTTRLDPALIDRFFVVHLHSGEMEEIGLSDNGYETDEMLDLLRAGGFERAWAFPAWDGLDLYDAAEWIAYVAQR